MKRLSSDFEFAQYGLICRLVNVDDAEYILSLRTNPKLNKYIHTTECNLSLQKEWIRQYKERESLGIEYYFIFYYLCEPVGVCRIYDIKDDRGTVGSWICSPNISEELPLLTLIITRNILFEILDAKYDLFDVRINNKKVRKMHLLFGALQIKEDDINAYYVLDEDTYVINRDKILKYLI